MKDVDIEKKFNTMWQEILDSMDKSNLSPELIASIKEDCRRAAYRFCGKEPNEILLHQQRLSS